MSKKISVDSDLHRTLSPPPSLSHVGDEHGTHYASAGDITSLSRPDTTSQYDSSEALGNSNQEALNYTALQMDQSSQGFPLGVDPDSPAHSDPTLRVHEESTVHEDTGKFADTDVKEFYQLFSDNEFRDSKMNVVSKKDSHDFDNSPRQISFGADFIIPDSSSFEERKKIKKTDKMDETLAFKTSSHITQLTSDSDDDGLKHEDRIIDAGIHMKKMVESSGIDDFPVSDGKELECNASEPQSQAANAKNGASASPLVTNSVSSSNSEERDNAPACTDTDGKLLSTVSQRSSSELPTPVQPFKGESLQHHTSYTMETAGKESPSVDAMPLATLYGVNSVDAAIITPADDSSKTNSGSSVLLSKDLEWTVDAKMLYSSKKALSVRFSDDVMEIPPPDEFEIGLNESHENAFPTVDSDFDSLNIRTRPELDSLDSMTEGTSITKVNTNSLNGLRVTGSVEMMKLHKEKMHGYGKNDMSESEMSFQEDQNCQNLEEREFKNIEEDSHLSALTALNSHFFNDSDKTFQQDFQIEQSSFITPHQSTDLAKSHVGLQSNQDDLSEEPMETQFSYKIIQIARNDMMESKPSVDEAEVNIKSLDQQIESQGACHKLDHPIQGGTGEQSIKIEETDETFWQPHQGSTEDLASQIEIESTIERLNRPENHEGFREQPVEHEQALEESDVKHGFENLVQSAQQAVLASEFETSLHKDLTCQSVEENGLKDIGEGSQSHLLSALNSHSVSYRDEISEQVFQTEQFSIVTPNQSTDSAESFKVNTADQQTKEEQNTSNDLIELKPHVEEMDGKTQNLDNQKESKGDNTSDLPIQGKTGELSIKIEEMGEKCLQSHESTNEDSAVSTELEHTIQRINIHEKHGKELVEHEQVLENSASNPYIESTGQSVQKVVHTVEPESESLCQEDQTCQGVEERQLKNIGECSHSCLLPALDSHSLDFQMEQSSLTTPQQYTDSAESPLTVKDTDLQSKVEDKEDAVEKSIEPQVSYALTDPAINDVTEVKLPIEEAERNTKSLDQQIESQGDGCKLDHHSQHGADGQCIKIEERGKTCLQAHKSSDENLTGSTELEHTLESSNIHDMHEVFGEQPTEHEKSVLNPCIESTRQSGQQIVRAGEAEFELSFQEEETYQNAKERSLKGIGEDSHSCLLPALDSQSVSEKCKIFQQDFQNEKSSVLTLRQTTDSAEFYFVKVMEQQSKEDKEKEIIVISMETQPSYAVIEGTSNYVIEGTCNDVIELKPHIEEAEEKHISIDYQIESQGASPKLDHLIHGGTDEQCIKTEETGEKHLQSHKSSIEDIASSREIEHIERLDRHENHERFGEQLLVHDPVLEKSVGKLCTESTGQAAQPSESLRNWPAPLHEAAMKEPLICPINAVNDSASLKKVDLIDQLQKDGGTPLKNVEDSDVLSACTSDVKVTFAKSADSLNIRQSSLPSLVQSEHGQLNVDMVDDRTKCAETEDCQDSNQGKHDEELSVPQMVTCEKDVSQPKIKIRKLEEDLEVTLDISHFPGVKIKPRKRKNNLGPAGTGFLGPQDSLQKVIPPSQLLKMKQKRIVGNISSKASSDSPAVSPANQKQNGIGTIKDFQTTNAYKEKGKVDSHKARQSAETTLYSDSEGNDTQDATNEENTNAIKEVPNSSSIEEKDYWQQLQTKPASRLDEAENVTKGGNTGKKSLPQLKTASSQPEGNIHQTSVGPEGQLEVLHVSVETKISKNEEGAKPGPSVITSQDCDMSASKPGSESMEKAVEQSVHSDTQRIITGLTATPCEGTNVDTIPNLTQDDERKPLRENCLDGKTNDQNRDIADMSGKNGNASIELYENNHSDCTMPSRLPEIYRNKNIETELLEVSRGQYSTTNHPQQLKDSDSLERKGNVDKPCGYVEVQNTFHSDTLPRGTERKEDENISANEGKLMYTRRTSLVDKVTQYEEMAASKLLDIQMQKREMADQSPILGEFQYKTPSGLLLRERNEGEDMSPGHSELLYKSSCRLLDKSTQSDQVHDQSSRYEEVVYKMPLGLLHKVSERKESKDGSQDRSENKHTSFSRLSDVDMKRRKIPDHSPSYGEFHYTTPSGENRSPGYGELKYTTPSRLLERHIQREEIPNHSPGYGEFLYTTPSGLVHRVVERNEGENRSPGYGELKYTTPSRLLERHIQREEIPDHSPGYGEFHYTTPSGLMHRAGERNEGENRSPGYGELKYTTPSRLLERHIQREEIPNHSPGYGEFLYTTPSGLVHRVVERNEGENRSPGYGELKYTTPSRLLERHIQREEIPDHSPGYGEFHYTTPSGLMHRAGERNEGENRSPGYGELKYTTPSRLLERHIQREEIPNHSPGYGEFLYTTPSGLVHRVVERNEGENRSPGYGELKYTTPSRLLERHIQREEIPDHSPGYGEFHYTTPSGLMHRAGERNEGENRSPGYGELKYTTPSRLLERHIQRKEIPDYSPGYGEFLYTTPSGLVHRAGERNEGENRSPGYGELKYTTPSRLLERHIQREEIPDHSPGYGEFHYTTPSGLLHRAGERNEGENRSPGYGELKYTTPSRLLERHIQREEIPDHSPGYGEFLYTTPSGLVQRIKVLNEGENRSPVYGELKYTACNRLLDRSTQSDNMSDQSPRYGEFHYVTPSGLLCSISDRKVSSDENKQRASTRLVDMDMKGRENPNHSQHFEESLYTTPTIQRDDSQQASEEKSPRYGKFCYVTPVVNYKDTKREDSKGKSQQSGQLLAIERRKGERDDKSSGHNTIRFSTPSLLLYQELLRSQKLDASPPGYRVPKQNSLIKVKSRTEAEGYSNQEYTTPSQILEKYNRATYASQSSPCLEYHHSTTPSQMLVRSFDQKKPENVTQGYEFPGNVSPSELFNRIQALENGRSQSLEGDVHKYLRYASEPLQIQMYRPYGIENLMSEYRYSAPSRLLNVMDQRRPAEPMTGKASSSRHPLPGDHNKYNEQNVRVEYLNPTRFFQKREDRDQARRSKAPGHEAFNDSIPLRLIHLDDTTRPAVLRDCDLEGQEEEAILYQQEYDNYVAADRNTLTGSYCMSDNKVPATVQYPPSFNKFYNEVSPAIPYSSTTAVGNFQYKTPSDVLHSVKERYGSEDRSPGYGEHLYTTPYRLLDGSTQTGKIFDQSPMFQYGPPSGLSSRVSDGKDGKDRAPSSGDIKYTGSIKVFDMDMKRREVTDHLPCFEEAVYTTPSGIIHREDGNQAFVQISPRYAQFRDVMPSVLLHDNSMGQVSDQNSYQLGNFQYKMPSQLLAVERRTGEIDDKSPGHRSIRYSTPSLLLYQELLRRQNLDASSPGYGVPMQDALTKVKSRTEDEGYDTTPSPILERSNKVTYASQSSPHFEYPFSRIPSQMLTRNIVQETPENVTQGLELPSNVRPSELFNRIQALENGISKPSEGEVHQYLRTPSPPLQVQMYRPYETEHLTSDGEYQYSAPSRLLEVLDQRRPAEFMAGKASSSRHTLPGDHNKYNEKNVRVEYINPTRFREDQARRSKIPKDEAFIASTPLRLVDLDDTTRPGQKPFPSAVLRDFDLEGQEKEAILYQHEYDNFIAADRNGNANNNVTAESSVDPDWEIRRASIASSQRLESNVPGAVQYTLAQSVNNSESGVPPTTQNLSTSHFNKSECTAAGTIQQASSESFSKLENEVEHAEIIHRLMVVLGNTAVFLAAYTEQEIISLLTLMKTGQKKKSNICLGKGNGPAGSSVQREGYGSVAPFLGNQEVKGPHHVAWMTSVCTLKVLKASLTSKSEGDLYQILIDIQSMLACANSFMKEHGNISLDALIRSKSDYHRSFDRMDVAEGARMDVAEGARRMSEPYRWFFSEEFVQTTTLQEFLNMIQNTPQIESSHIVLRTKPFKNVRGGDVNSADMTVPFQDSVHIQGLFSGPVYQPRTHTSDSQIKHLHLQQKMDRIVNSDFSPRDISNISYAPSHARNSVIWQNRNDSLFQSVSDFQDFCSGKSPETLQSKRGSSFSLVINPSFNLSSDEEDLDTASKWDTVKGQIASSPEIKKYKTNKKLFKQGAGKDKSPDQGQRLYGSSLGLNWHSDGKKGRGGGRPGTSPDARNFMMEKELILSQNRKLQGEISTLQTENKLLKEKYNRIQARIAEIENEMQVTQSELETLLETTNQEINELTNSSRLANQKDKEQFQSKILALTKENESFKLETASLEKQVESSRKLLDTVRQAGEKSKLLEAQKAELNAVNEQLGHMRELLEQREQHFHKEEEQHNETRKQVQSLTELKNLLQQQSGATDDEAVIDKQIQSLEKRLKVTEERLYQERADRANNLSQVEEKLLAENAQFQVIENDLSRKLQREKEKNRNLEKNIKDLREEIEKLHLALPFDESLLTLKKGNYSIPYSSHSSQRAESLRSNDMNYIMAQIEKEDGLGAGQEQDIIQELWNKRKLAYMQLHELEIQLVELGISDNIAEGLKNLRDNYGQAETKMKTMEEKLSDMQFEMAALENTYKQQLTALVHERHDALAHLKTAEDLLEALKTENQSLRLSLTGSHSTTAHQDGGTAGRNAETELLRSQVQSLEGHLEQVISRNNLLEGELKMVNVQLNSRNQALQESKEELELLYDSLKDNEASNSQQQKIDRLSTQVNDLNAEIGMLNDRNNTLLSEKEKLEDTLAAARKREISLQKIKQQQKANIAQIEDLREELNEKEHKIENQKWQLHELDGQLQKVRQDLYMEQEHTDELETEVESLQQTVTQRAQMFEALMGSEQEQLAQFQLLKDTLDSVSKELDQKKAKVTSLELDLSLSKNRVEELERNLKELRQERSYDTKFHPPPQSSMEDRLRIRELEGERTALKHDMAQLHSTVQLTKEQTSQAQKELRQLESELVKARTTILQLSAEKHELEQHLEIAEENDSLIQERGQAEEDLVKLEKKLQEILEKFEQEARKQHGNFETRYVNIPADSRKLLNELDSLRLLLEGKEREAEMIQDRSMRQQMEVNFLQKKVELIQNQMISNREDIARMVNELATKMKEAVRTREINQFLVHERTKLQTENDHLEKDLEKERETKVQMKKEIEEISKKIEMSQMQSKSTAKEAQDKDNLLATIEADLRNATRNLTHLELEVNQQKNKIERLNNDIKNLTNINSTLEKRLETEKNALAEEKETSRRLKDDLTNMTHKLEMLQHEHQLTQDKLATEQQTVEKLRNQSQSYHEECDRLKEEVTAHKSHVDILRGQVLLGKDDLEKLKQEKESLRHEYELLCRQLNDKENELRLHREESLHKLDTLQRELHEEKTTLENNQTLVQKELDLTRSELESLKEKLHHKEIQLQSFVRTLQELEVVTREKQELETNVQRLEGLVRDNKVILDGQRKEIMIHMEANSKHQEMLAKAEVTNQKLYGELRAHQENSQHEIRELQITIKEMQSQHEAERSALSESLSQTQSQLHASQSHLALAADTRDKLQGRVRILERDLEEIKTKLSDESTGRHLTEHSVGSLRLQLEDTRNQKIVAEARLSEMEKALAKTESQLKVEKDKLKKLSGRIQEAEISNHSTESSVKAKQEQVDLLQNENSKLRQMLESQKQSLMSKMKMATLDIKQQLEMVQNERDKMSSQIQKLSIDLDQSREQIAMKNKENYKQQEEILALEDQVKECKFKLKAAEDSLRTETSVQDQLTHRYAEQEEELKVLKNFLAKKAEESGDADKAMWHEMNHVIQELSRQMQSHLESQKHNKDARETSTQIQKLKRQIMDLQGELATERSLHQITRDSLQALEEDCKRLRHQLHVLRRRESSASDKKYKNRMEAINAIIAKSQSQAQALLASGGYHDDINSPRPDYNIYSPRMGYRSPSPHMGYSSPQRAFSPDNSVTSEFSIASTGPMVPTFESSVPHKSQGRRN